MNPKSFNINRQVAPIRMQTIQNLREAILDDYFKPGDRLYEKELCEQFGVSRTSVREALRQLESEGLVSAIPNQGPIVTKVSLEEAQDIYQVRELLECLAVRLFAERASQEQVCELARAVKDLEKAYLTNDVRAFLNVKTTMYDIIFAGSGNQVAHSIFRTLVARVNILRKTSLAQTGRTRASFEEIQEILTAIQERDPQKAYEKCLEHVRRASAVALKSLSLQSGTGEAVRRVVEPNGEQPV